MGLFDKWLKKPSEPVQEKKVKPLDPQFGRIFFTGAPEISSQNDNDDTFIDKGYRLNPTVFSIIHTVSKNAAMANWKVFKKDKNGNKVPHNSFLLQKLLENPNGLGSWNHLMKQAIGFKMLTGNVYFWGIKGKGSGKISSLHILPSQEVQIHVDRTGRFIQGYSLDFYGRDGDEVIPAEDILHIKDFNPSFNENNDFLYGQSPLQAALTTLHSNNDAIDTGRSYLRNQGPRGILTKKETSGNFNGLEMDEAATNAMKRAFKRNYTGTANAGELLISPSELSWVEVGGTAADIELLNHYGLTQNEICNIYSFPTLLLSNGQSSYANQQEAKKALWNNAITPILCEIRDALNQWLAPQFGDGICIDFDLSHIADLQDDWETRAKVVQHLQGLYTVNELREKLGDPPLNTPEGDELYIFRQGVKENDNGESTDTDKPGGREEDSA